VLEEPRTGWRISDENAVAFAGQVREIRFRTVISGTSVVYWITRNTRYRVTGEDDAEDARGTTAAGSTGPRIRTELLARPQVYRAGSTFASELMASHFR